ncbi:MAG: hypothetical protein IJ412_01005 [Oscillospiraceae bacterium]|nr:hypothetical protein [Oscillospiraceae bacterium]
MKERELKHLSRAELLELLLAQTKETERLSAELEQAQRELADRRLRLQEAGSLAQAAIEINGVMEAAQAAAQQYLDNIRLMEEEARQQCEQMLADAEKKAARIRQDLLKDAKTEASQLTQKLLEDARVKAEQATKKREAAARQKGGTKDKRKPQGRKK